MLPLLSRCGLHAAARARARLSASVLLPPPQQLSSTPADRRCSLDAACPGALGLRAFDTAFSREARSDESKVGVFSLRRRRLSSARARP